MVKGRDKRACERGLLTLEELAVQARIPKKRLKQHWAELVEAELAQQFKVCGNTIMRLADPEDIPAIFEKLFWLMYEDQTIGKNCAPYLKPGVAARVWQEVCFPDHPAKYVAELTAMPVDRLRIWFEEGGPRTVVLFERFLMRYRGVDLFDHVDILHDIVLLNNTNKNEGLAS